MKGFFALALFSAVICLAYSATGKTKADSKAAVEKCRKEFNVDEKTVAQIVKFEKLPDDHNAKCMIACYMNEMGLLNNGKFDLEALKEGDKATLKDPVKVEKAVEVDKKCTQQVGTDEKDACEMAHKFVNCLITEGKAAGLPPPSIV